MWFLEDENRDTLSRDVVTIWDSVAEVGGLIEIIGVFGIFLVSHF
jgi:hypothetical protein